MRPFFTSAQQGWFKPATNLVALATLVLCAGVLVGWYLQVNSLVQLHFPGAPVNPNTAASILVFSISILGYVSGRRSFALLAIVPGVYGLLSLIQVAGHWDLGIDDLLASNYLRAPGSSQPHLHPVVAVCLALTGASLPWLYSRRKAPMRTLGLAFSGSVLASIGFSTLLGYALSLPAVSRWGTSQDLPGGVALLLFILGHALLLNAWQEQQRERLGLPAWLPLPFIVTGATITGILWIGLREVERVRLSATSLSELRPSYLPELVLGAGCGITLLLGLSVHLARAARAGLRAAELSNRELRLSQAATRKMSLVASKTDNLVIIASPSGVIEWVNESFERIMEYSLTEVTGCNAAELVVGPETSSRTIRRIRAAATRGVGVSTDIVNYSKSGRKYHLHLEVQPVRNEAGELQNFIAILADITSRVETEQNLRRAKAEADAASRAKSEFLASMSHEIRTPMNGVIGMTSLLLDTHLDHEQRDFVSTIRTSGESLLTIINDILDFSKIESGRMELEALPFELAVCVEDALDLFSVQAAAKKLELTYRIAPEVPAWIQGDVTRLRQVLANLVNNAVKFTSTGSISVRVERSEKPAASCPADRTELTFLVEDTGIGIPSDRLNRLFRPFSQVDSSTTRKYGGTGLGLVICQRLCALMGGEITVESAVGLGSTFRFTLQTEPIHTPPGWGLPELPVRLNYGDLLCIEDHPISQERLRTFFELWGARPFAAATATAALERLSQDPPPIAIVLDHAMVQSPEGGELRARLCRCDVPALLLLSPGERLEDLAAFSGRRGIATATKPLRTHALVRGIQALFDSPPDSLPPFVVPDGLQLLAHEIPLEILLVEDNPVNQKVALRFLDRLGYRSDAVANGIEALNTLQSRNYQLILMDLQMPEMDGFETARQIRARTLPQQQPRIIALTANALNGDREQCLAAGMDDYITKPVKLLDIAQVIRRQFSITSRPPFSKR